MSRIRISNGWRLACWNSSVLRWLVLSWGRRQRGRFLWSIANTRGALTAGLRGGIGGRGQVEVHFLANHIFKCWWWWLGDDLTYMEDIVTQINLKYVKIFNIIVINSWTPQEKRKKDESLDMIALRHKIGWKRRKGQRTGRGRGRSQCCLYSGWSTVYSKYNHDQNPNLT